MSVASSPDPKKKKSKLAQIYRQRNFYLMVLPAVIYAFVFSYLPMSGLLMAFKVYRFNTPSLFGDVPILRFLGQMLNMEWAGLDWFSKLFAKPDYIMAVRNTLIISFGRLLIEFPCPIILALLLNEVMQSKIKRIYQTVYTFPHFLSWVLIATIMTRMLVSDGLVNNVINAFGGESVKFLLEPGIFRGVIFASSIWKGAGWGSIIYLATISGIDPTLYEAAIIDGANRWQRVRFITWPSIKPTVVILLILQSGTVLNGGFDQIFNLYNTQVYSVADIIDTFIYRFAFEKAQNLSLTVAAGLLKAVVNFLFLLTVNTIARWLGEEGLL